MRLERDQLKEQLIAARLAVTQRKGDAERLRADWESARSTGEETRASLIRAESRNRRLDSSITSLSSELRALESEHASNASSSGDTIRRLRMELATLHSCALRRRCTAAEGAFHLEQRDGGRAKVGVRECDCLCDAVQQQQETASRLEAAEAQIAELTAERDGALGELASQKRVADSLRLELKKAMQKAAMQQAQKGGEAS